MQSIFGGTIGRHFRTREPSKIDKKKWTQEAIAKAVGKQQADISKTVSLLDLPMEVQENIRQRILSKEHGIELTRISNTNSRKVVAKKVVEGGLTSRGP